MSQNPISQTEDFILKWITAEAELETGESVEVHVDTKLLEESVFDSMKLLTLVGALEEQFHIEIGAEDMIPTHFSTPRSIARLVDRLQKVQNCDLA